MDDFDQLAACMETISLIDQKALEGLAKYGALTPEEALRDILHLITQLNKRYREAP
jgi:hypothetical protein